MEEASNYQLVLDRYHQFLEIQHDREACLSLYASSSQPLVLEVKALLFRVFIQKAPLFQELKPEGIGELIDHFQEQIFSPGDYVIAAGQDGYEMFFLLKGECDVLINPNLPVGIDVRKWLCGEDKGMKLKIGYEDLFPR